MNPGWSSCINSHMSVPLPGLTLRTSLYTCIYSQVHICCITNTFVYEPMLCNLTYVCALASAHTQNPFVCIHVFTGIHACILLLILLYMNRCCANLHMSVPLRVLTLWTSCLYTYSHKYTNITVYHRYFCIWTQVAQLASDCALASAHA